MSVRTQISQAARNNQRREEVTIPEWNGAKVEARSLSGGQEHRLLDTCYKPGPEGAGLVAVHELLYPYLLIHGAYDTETGEPIWQAGDEPEINAYDGAGVRRLGSAILRLSGLSEDGEKVAAGNSDGTAISASPSPLPAN